MVVVSEKTQPEHTWATTTLKTHHQMYKRKLRLLHQNNLNTKECLPCRPNILRLSVSILDQKTVQ